MGLRVSNVTSQILFKGGVVNRTVQHNLNLIQDGYVPRKIRMSNLTAQILVIPNRKNLICHHLRHRRIQGFI